MESKMLSPFVKFTLFRKTSSFSFFSFPGTFEGPGMISGFKEDNGPPTPNKFYMLPLAT
jgi:hypothetical protein